MIGLGTAATQLDTSVNIAFPAITRGFGLAIGDIQWVVISYVLTYASLLLALGRIGDTVGHALVFRIGLIWSAVALLLVSWSPSYGAMLVFRCLQGIGAALVLSCGAALVTSLYGEERRSRALGIYTMMLSLGLMLGPLLGGALTAVWDWPAVFLFRIPIAIAPLLLLGAMPASPPRPASDRFDVLGRHRAGAGPRDDADDAQPSSRVLRRLVRTDVRRSLCGLYFPRSRRAARPIIAVDILRRPGFALLNLVSVLANLAAFSIWLLVPYFLARVPGYIADRERRHSGCGRGRRCAGRADRRPARRAAHFRRAAGDSRRRRHWRRSSACSARGRNKPRRPCGSRGWRAGLGLGLFQLAYSDIVTAALPLAGPRRRGQPRPADANAWHGDRGFRRADGV